MRFIYFLLTIIATVNLLILLVSGLTNINIYKVYGKSLLKGFCQFMLLLVAFMVAIALSGLSS